jgi:hypothetical protein
MKHIYLTCFICLASAISGFSQTQINWQWTNAKGSTGQDDIVDLKVDNQGNSVVAGKFSGTMNFSTSPSISYTAAGIYDMFVAKLTSAGALSWARSLTGPKCF